MSTFKLSYSGQKRVESQQRQQAHDLLDALLTLQESESAISVDTGQIRPQPRQDSLLLIVSISAEADYNTLQSVQGDLAQSLVNLGVEPDVETAQTEIRITN
jgi:hypothetical protein